MEEVILPKETFEMNPKPLVQGVRICYDAQSQNQREVSKQCEQQQQRQHQHQNQHQHHYYHPQPQHNYQHIPHPPTTYHPPSNPFHESYHIPSVQEAPSSSRTQNFDNIKTFQSKSRSNRSILPASKNSIPSRNQDALQQLENNLRMVLIQQTQQKPPQILQQPARHPQRIRPTSTSENYRNKGDVTHDRTSQGQPYDGALPDAFQKKTLSYNPISYGNSMNTSKERISISVEDDTSGNRTVLQQRQRCIASNPNSCSSHVPSLSINPVTTELFALENEVLPLPTSNQQKEIRSSLPQAMSSDACWGNWSDDTNDVFMNKLFHAELKMGKQKVGGDKDMKLGSSSADANACPIVDKSVDMSAIFPNHDNTMVEESNEVSNLSIDTPELLPCEELNGKTKARRKKEPKSRLSPSKPKQKRKSRSKRKPKFLTLQKDPPIEEQILALPVITLAPSLLAKIAMKNPRQSFPKKDDVANKLYIPNYTTNMIRHLRSGIDDTCTSAKVDGNIVPDDDETSPLDLFRKLLKARGHDELYSVQLEGTVYETDPSPLQLASYGTHLVRAIQFSDSSLVRKLLGCGLSPNACNQFRDSLLGDLVCKQGNVPMFMCFVDEFDADLRVVDGFGRMLLHHCCWAHGLCRPIVEYILQRDPIQVFLRDKQDKTPLEYVRSDASGHWKRFLIEVADTYWPMDRNLPKLSPLYPRRRQANGDLQDSRKALSPALAVGLSSGTIAPESVSSMIESPRKKKRRKQR